MANFFSNSKDGKPNGSKTRGVFANVVAHAVMSCYIIMGIFAVYVMIYTPEINYIKVIENIFVVITITVGAFLALAKDIFNPRREITMDEITDLVKFMSKDKTDIEIDATKVTTLNPARKSGFA